MEITENSLTIHGALHPSRREWTVREYAKAEKVDPRTVRRWIAKGALVFRRNAGGGIRILGERK